MEIDGNCSLIDGNWWELMEIDGNCNLILAHYQEIGTEMSYEIVISGNGWNLYDSTLDMYALVGTGSG